MDMNDRWVCTVDDIPLELRNGKLKTEYCRLEILQTKNLSDDKELMMM